MERFPRNSIWKPDPEESSVGNFVKNVGKFKSRYKRRISYSTDTVWFFLRWVSFMELNIKIITDNEKISHEVRHPRCVL